MLYHLRISVITIMLFITSMVSHAADLSREDTQNKSNKPQIEKKIRSKKSLLAALLMMDLMSSKKRPRSTSNRLAFPDMPDKSTYPLPFLRSSKMKESAIEALYKKHGFNNVVELNLRSFSYHKYSFQKRLARSGRYIGTMAEIFSEHGLPRELVFLPLIESEFNPYAYSRKRASGPWQFMPATAKNLNLKIDWWIDERRDPIKSTRAAASYLKYLYKKFESWNLALAAYNAGEGKIDRALKSVGKKDFWTLRSTGYLARETENYVPSYIAATAIAMDPENFGFLKVDYHEPFTYDEVIIHTPMDLKVAAKFAGARTLDVKALNPELRRLCTPPNVPYYKLKIPKGTKRRFLKNLARTKGNESYYINLYTVKSGDTVKKIAQSIGSTIQEIVDINALGARALIMAGRNILVPIERSWDRVLQESGHY